MSAAAFGSLTLALFALILTAHLLGWFFVKLRQPRVVGEILAGVLLGPCVLGHLAPNLASGLFGTTGAHAPTSVVLGFLYNLGLLLLMFVSGAETKGLFNRQDTREVAWLGGIGTAVPFVLTIAVAPFLPLGPLMGPHSPRMSIILVIGIAMAVTSIPVISKILHDLDILHTRFARLILGVAVMEDVVLWAVLAVATALAQSGNVPNSKIVLHVTAALIYFALGLFVAPTLLKKINRQRVNVLASTMPVAYVFLVMLAYCAVAAIFDVSLVFAAFLAGLAVIRDKRLADAVKTIGQVSFAIFIPVYFAVVGYQLDFTKSFSLTMLVTFLALACIVKSLAAGMGARLAGFPMRDSLNLAAALNARGGPGIVLASVAYEAGIVSAPFYTTLVLVAIITSQFAGAWLDAVLRRGDPLLSGQDLPAHETKP
ncbi:MAG TPA: cation:proton antiporter, partial [Terriglobales bacterium]